MAVAGLFGGAAGGIAFDQEEFGSSHVLTDAIGEFSRQCGPGGDPFSDDFVAGLEANLGVLDGEFGNPVTGFGVLVEPEDEGVLDGAGDEGGAFPAGEAFLGLSGELRIVHLDGEDEAAMFPDVVGGELDAARQEIAKFAVFAQAGDESGAQSVYMGSALQGGDEVYVAFGDEVPVPGWSIG